MGAGGGYLQPTAFGGADEFTASAAHVSIQFVDVLTDFCADLDDGLVHLGLNLLAEFSGSGHEFGDVRTQLTRGGINNLKFLFNTNRETVTHARPLRAGDARTEAVSYRDLARLSKRLAGLEATRGC